LERPSGLLSFYVSSAALQVLNAHSAFPVLDGEARELNPVLSTSVSSRAEMLAVKAALTAGTIYVCEKLWKKNRVAAVAVMIGLNSALAVATAHNYRITHRSR